MQVALAILTLGWVFVLGAVVCLRQSPKAVRSLCYWGLALADAREKLESAERRIARERHEMFESLDRGGEPVELLAIRVGSMGERDEQRRIHRP